MNKNLILLAAAVTLGAQAQPTSACRQQLWQDSRAVAADLTVIRNEIVGGDSDAYRQAVEQVADSLTANVPAMGPALETAFSKYLGALRDVAADDVANGLVVAPLEQLKLANATLMFIVASGSGDSPIDPILSGLIAALGSIEGVSTGQLNSDVTALISDANGCKN